VPVSVFVRKVVTKSGAHAVQIVTKHGREVTGIEHIGSAHTEKDLAVLVEVARERIRERTHEAGQEDLVIAREIEPASKLETIRILEELGLRAPSNSAIHRSLDRAARSGYRERISEACVSFRGVEELTLVLYDVTTLYFQIERKDDYRKPGLSKERRLEPQVVIGLLVDERGFPLQVHSFEGNTAETLTIVPMLDALRQVRGTRGGPSRTSPLFRRSPRPPRPG